LITVLGDCINGTRTLSYLYPESKYCDNSTSNLTDKVQILCEVCKPGSFYNSKENGQYSCEICTKGSYSDWNSLAKDNTQCIQCSNNFFSSNIYNLTSFSNIDNVISTTCKSENSKNCENIKGFQKRFDKIISVIKIFT